MPPRVPQKPMQYPLMTGERSSCVDFVVIQVDGTNPPVVLLDNGRVLDKDASLHTYIGTGHYRVTCANAYTKLVAVANASGIDTDQAKVGASQFPGNAKATIDIVTSSGGVLADLTAKVVTIAVFGSKSTERR